MVIHVPDLRWTRILQIAVYISHVLYPVRILLVGAHRHGGYPKVVGRLGKISSSRR